jgi:hypothetical protein
MSQITKREEMTVSLKMFCIAVCLGATAVLALACAKVFVVLAS